MRQTYKFGLRHERILLQDLEAATVNGQKGLKLDVSVIEDGNCAVSAYQIELSLIDLERYQVVGEFDITETETVKSAERHGKAIDRFIQFLIGETNQNDLFGETIIDVLQKMPEDFLSLTLRKKLTTGHTSISAIKDAELKYREERVKKLIAERNKNFPKAA